MFCVRGKVCIGVYVILGLYVLGMPYCLFQGGKLVLRLQGPTSSLGMDHKLHLVSGGQERTALLHIPPVSAFPGPIPLIVDFHAMFESGRLEADLDGMSELADKAGFAVLYPDGLAKASVLPWLPGNGHSWNGGGCCPGGSSERVDDVQFVKDLIPFGQSSVATLTQNMVAVDVKKLYGVGTSNGGFLLNRVSCQAPGLFAAIGIVGAVLANESNAFWQADPYPCPSPEQPLPVIHFHGMTDVVVPWFGNWILGFPSVASDAQKRKALNGIPAGDEGYTSLEHSFVKCTAYGTAASNFTFCGHLHGHCWPGRTTQGPCTTDIDATTEIWAFLKRYQLE